MCKSSRRCSSCSARRLSRCSSDPAAGGTVCITDAAGVGVSVGVAVGVGATGVGGLGVGSTGAAVGVAVNVGVLMASAEGLGGMVRVGAGVGAGSSPQAADTNRTTDRTSSEMWSFTIFSLAQGGLAIQSGRFPSRLDSSESLDPSWTATAGPQCSLPTMLPCGPGVSNEEAGGLRPSKKADPRVSLFADALSYSRPVYYAVQTGSTSAVRARDLRACTRRPEPTSGYLLADDWVDLSRRC